MISLNGLYTTLRGAIKELTGVEVYQNISKKSNIIEARWLFIKTIYYLFDNSDGEMIYLKKPAYKDIAFQLGYSNTESVYYINKRYTPTKENIRKLQILKELFTEYTNVKISKERLKELLVKEKFTLTDVIDCVIELNGLIGVGLITLGESLDKYCRNKIK